jgi:WD40 repeat protein
MRGFAALAVLLWVTAAEAYSQGRMNHWIFGHGYHVEFTQSGPVFRGMRQGYLALDGAASISDLSGNLLYYSNSSNIWNVDTQQLLNGDMLFENIYEFGSSITSASLFLPWPGDTLEYFFAYINIANLHNRVYYSKINATFDGGYGGVLEDMARIKLWDTVVAEQMTAIKHANGRDWWLLFRTRFGSSSGPHTHFLYTLFGPNGFSEPVSISAGPETGFMGEMTASPQGDYIAYADHNKRILWLYSFDRCTGQIAFVDSIAARRTTDEFYGLAFSPDGSKMYVSTMQSQSILQYKLESGVLIDTIIYNGLNNFANRLTQLELGPDGKIYGAFMREPMFTYVEGYDRHLFVINNPNASGAACQFDTFGLYLGETPNFTYSLPNFPNYDLGPLVGSPCDTLSPS